MEESEICACKTETVELVCSVISPVPDKPCNSDFAFYSHDSPFYLPHRGGCVCYSGDIICAKEDFTKAFKKDQVPVPPTPLEGVYLFLGFSRKDARMVMEGRKEVSDKVPDNDEEEEMEVVATVQQAVSYFTSNNNKVLMNENFVIIIFYTRSV